jgi:uncharacterized delta-60 repeat protein
MSILICGCDPKNTQNSSSHLASSAFPLASPGSSASHNSNTQSDAAQIKSTHRRGISRREVSGLDTKSIALNELDQLVVGGFGRHLGRSEIDVKLARFNPNGKLDTSFGNQGVFAAQYGSHSSWITAIAIQDDGKIIAVGAADNGSNREVLLIRLNSDGKIDDSFANHGIKKISLLNTNTGSNSSVAAASGVSIQNDGKIVVVANNYWSAPGNYYGTDVNIFRFHLDGSFDPSFGDGGTITTKVGDSGGAQFANQSAVRAYSIATTPAGKIVLAGKSFAGGLSANPATGDHFTVLQYTQNGQLDTSFGTNGIVRLSLNTGANESSFDSLFLQNDGKIVAAGGLRKNINNEWHHSYALVRFNENGTLDSTFGTGGVSETQVTPPDVGFVPALKTLPDGTFMGLITINGTSYFLAKFLSDGTWDTSYGTNGIEELKKDARYMGLTLSSKGELFTLEGSSDFKARLFRLDEQP